MSTLKDVGKRALTDEAFFKELLKDIDATLKKYGMSLSSADLSRLRLELSKPPVPGQFTVADFIGRVHATSRTPNAFAGWDSDWDLAWLGNKNKH
jgi:hypothetical protein